MKCKKVDCIILAMLKEERDSFLQYNDCFFYENSNKHKNFLEFDFIDKNNIVRTGVFCSGDTKMGITEAASLFYKISRSYKSELYINIGVVGYINDVKIGDVLIVNDNSSLCERNATDTTIQQTDAILNTNFIEGVYHSLKENFSEIFKEKSKLKMRALNKELSKHIKKAKSKDDINTFLEKRLTEICKHEYNEINLGRCVTYHSVVKDAKTRDLIKEDVRKTNIVDMEAFYFNAWHQLIKETEACCSCKNSNFLIIKSVSDTAEESEKKELEKIGTRGIALSNINDVVSYFLTNLYDFKSKGPKVCLYDFFEKNISIPHIDRFVRNYTSEEKIIKFENMIKPFITLNEQHISNCIKHTCNLLETPNQTIVLEGGSGKGKSSFISLVYSIISQEKKAIYINIPKIHKKPYDFSYEQCLFLLKRIINHEKEIIIFIDGLEGNHYENDDKVNWFCKEIISAITENSICNIGLCIGSSNSKNYKEISKNILNKLNVDNKIEVMVFRSISAFDKNIETYIDNFAEFYSLYNSDFDKQKFKQSVVKVMHNNKFKLQYMDFRLLYMFAKYLNLLTQSDDICVFMDKYCDAIDGKTNLLTKNIYSRDFAKAKYIYEIFVHNNKKKISRLLKNDYVLSDNINLFLEYKLNLDKEKARKFFDNVLSNLKNNEVKCCSKTQLIYNLAFIDELNATQRKKLKDYISEEILQLSHDTTWLNNRDSILMYRTLSIILAIVFGENNYLIKFNEALRKNKYVKAINLNFHLLYYSQSEFTYNNVEDAERIDEEVIYNTYQILANVIKDNKKDSAFLEMCIITLVDLVKNTSENKNNYPFNYEIHHTTFQNIQNEIREFSNLFSEHNIKKSINDLINI